MFKRTLFRGANASRVEVPTKCTVKENAQALVAPGRFVVEGSFRRSENASCGQGFLVAHLVSVLVPDAFLESFSGVWRSAFAAIRLP